MHEIQLYRWNITYLNDSVSNPLQVTENPCQNDLNTKGNILADIWKTQEDIWFQA